MKKLLLFMFILLVLTGCGNKNKNLKDKSLIIGEESAECDYLTLYEDDKLIFRSFCMPQIYVKGNDNKTILLKDALNNKLLDVYDIMDGMEILEIYENGDVDLRNIETGYHILNCSKRDFSHRENEERVNLYISKFKYDKMICDH